MNVAVRIWNTAVPSERGTISCLVRWNGNYALLSVAHVLAPTCLGISPAARPIVECGMRGAPIGVLRNWDLAVNSSGMPHNFSCDAAVASIDEETAAELVRSWNYLPSGIRSAPLDRVEQLRFIGAGSETTHVTILQDGQARADFRYSVYALGQGIALRGVDVSLRGLIQTDRRGDARGGDSGALLRDSDEQAIGILVGVDHHRSYCYFSPIAPILAKFDAQLVTRKDPLASQIRRS